MQGRIIKFYFLEWTPVSNIWHALYQLKLQCQTQISTYLMNTRTQYKEAIGSSWEEEVKKIDVLNKNLRYSAIPIVLVTVCLTPEKQIRLVLDVNLQKSSSLCL